MLRFMMASIGNIGVGFIVAVLLGRRYKTMIERRAWNALAATLPALPAQREKRTPRVETPKELPPEVAAEAKFEPAVLRPKSESQQAVEEMQQKADEFGNQLSEADAKLRECAVAPDLGEIESLLTTIEASARDYLESRDSAHRKLSELTRDADELGEVSNEIQIATQLQDAEIRATCEEIAKFDYESDLTAGCQKIVGRTNKLLNSNDAVRDALQKALAEVAQLDCRPPEECDRSDPLTGCINRAAIEADLSAWWASDPEHRRLCVAKIDIDRLSEVNEQFGYRTGNEILKAVANILEIGGGDHIKTARFSGQCFLVMCSDMDLAAATNKVEHWRQTIENAHFEYKDFDIHVTVSCSVTQTLADDTPSTVLLRAGSALHDAKRYGHNRTFIHEGKYPTPVVPPDLTIEQMHIQVGTPEK